MTERVLPHSPDLEVAVLGAMLQDEGAAAIATALLTPDAFYQERNRLIFQAAARCLSRGVRPDPLVVADALSQAGKLPEGGAASLFQVVEQAPTVANVGYHARLLREKAERRRIIQAAEEIAAAGYRDQEPVAEYRALAEAMLFRAIQDGHATELLTPAGLAATLDRQAPPFVLTAGLSVWDAPAPILAEGRLVVLAGRPGIGKTALACAILARHALAEPPVRCLFLSCEQTGREVAERILALHTGRTLYETQTDLHPWDVERLERSGLYLSDAGAPSLATVLGQIRAARASYGIRMAVVDHIGKVSGGRKETRTLEVGDVARGLKAVAKDLHIPVLALCQLNRNIEARNVKRPQLSDLRESGEIEQEADAVVFLWTDEETMKKAHLPVSMTLAKNRHGPTREQETVFDRPRLRFNPEGTEDMGRR